MLRLDIRTTTKSQMLPPMNIFTQEKLTPAERTIKFIKQMAYTYRVITIKGKTIPYNLN